MLDFKDKEPVSPFSCDFYIWFCLFFCAWLVKSLVE